MSTSAFISGNLDAASKVLFLRVFLNLWFGKPMVCVRVAFHENDGNHKNDENDEDNSDSYKQGVECWIRGNHGNHENDENHGNPGCKPRVPQTTGLEVPDFSVQCHSLGHFRVSLQKEENLFLACDWPRPPHRVSRPFGPGTPQESEKSPERVFRGRAPKGPKECAPECRKSPKRVYPKNLFGLILTSKGYFKISGCLK